LFIDLQRNIATDFDISQYFGQEELTPFRFLDPAPTPAKLAESPNQTKLNVQIG
jgi:hypothetical protein